MVVDVSQFIIMLVPIMNMLIPFLIKNKDKESYIISLDANSLHYTAMCYKLPQGEPKLDNNISEYTHKYTQNLHPNGKYSHTFVVDIHYPKNLHDRDFEYPLLTVHVIPKGKKVKKLMSIFYDKYKNTISVLMLKYILEKGLELIKVHYVIYAEQFKFMEPYILLNNEKRTQCSIKKYKMDVESWKLMNNSVFGMQSEYMIKYMDRRFANNENEAKKLAGKVTFKDFHILSENVALWDMKKTNIFLNQYLFDLQFLKYIKVWNVSELNRCRVM